jgi:hypothetical protein
MDQPPSPDRPDPKQSGTPLWLYIICVGIGAVGIAVLMVLLLKK